MLTRVQICNINAIDYEIQKREEEAKAFSSMLQAQMQAIPLG